MIGGRLGGLLGRFLVASSAAVGEGPRAEAPRACGEVWKSSNPGLIAISFRA